jgi:DNA-directed RNA polymerase specialized sigma24 family protein
LIPFCILVIEDDDDREFMAALFIQYQRLLYKEINDILKNPWNTEDVLQATLVKLIDKIPELRNKEQPQLIGYISVTARNTAYNFLRSQKIICMTRKIRKFYFLSCSDIQMGGRCKCVEQKKSGTC